MTGLSKITDKIISDASAEADKRLALADEECEKIREEYRVRAERETEALSEKAKTEAAQLAARTKAEASTLKKNMLLAYKVEKTDEAFRTAIEDLAALPDKERLAFLTKVLISAVRQEFEAEKERIEIYGSDLEEDETVGDYQVVLNKKDKEKLGDDLIASFKRSIVGKDLGDMPSRISLSKETANIEGGLILRCGSIELNCSFEKLVYSCRASLEGEVLNILFPPKKEQK